MSTKPYPINALVIGDSGAKKSTFLATFPKPILVKHFDPTGKSGPYRRLGEATKIKINSNGTPYYDVMSRKTGNLLARVELCGDQDARKPQGYRNFKKSMLYLPQDLRRMGAKTIGIDSLTFMELAARNEERFHKQKNSKHAMKWYAGATDALEEELMIRLINLNLGVNVVVTCHVSQEKDEVHGMMVYNPKAPGRLQRGLPAGYEEVYRAYVEVGRKGPQHWLQTQASEDWNCASQIPAPYKCRPYYKALWEGESDADTD